MEIAHSQKQKQEKHTNEFMPKKQQQRINTVFVFFFGFLPYMVAYCENCDYSFHFHYKKKFYTVFRYCVISNSIINKSDKNFIFGKKNSIKTFKRIFFIRCEGKQHFLNLFLFSFSRYFDAIGLFLTHTHANCFHFFFNGNFNIIHQGLFR